MNLFNYITTRIYYAMFKVLYSKENKEETRLT